MENRENIENNVREWVEKNISTDFVFRKYQFEIICDIIDNILNNDSSHTHIIEAPTGSGKSLINIICAGVLSKYYGKTSYILCSDLFLWDQYNKFIHKHHLGIGSIKGQVGNYKCSLNGEDLKNGECRVENISWASLLNPKKAEKLGYDCAMTCKYVKERSKALRSNVVLMTYQLFILAMSLIKDDDVPSEYRFSKKDVIFCDEAHNIPDIVQTQWTPTIKKKDFEKICELFDKTVFCQTDIFDDDKKHYDALTDKYSNSDILYKMLTETFDKMTDDDISYDDNYDMLADYINTISLMLPVADDALDTVKTNKVENKFVSKNDLDLYKLANWLKTYYGFFVDFINSIDCVGKETLIKQTNNNDKNDKIIQYNCTKEDYLVYKYIMSKAKNKVMLSATVGGKEAFDENIGIRFTNEESIMAKIPSTFDFSKSPIFFYNHYKMSYRDKAVSFKYLKSITYQICANKFAKEKGIIQTGSYANAKELYINAPYEIKSRMLLYNDSKEKEQMIRIHQLSNDPTILVGPTLNEGIDLPDDMCRFIIILKVPYPSLANKLVKAKLAFFPHWYASTTSNDIIQGIGRGIRNENDYCTTYILDACFASLYNETKEQYAPELQKRIKVF